MDLFVVETFHNFEINLETPWLRFVWRVVVTHCVAVDICELNSTERSSDLLTGEYNNVLYQSVFMTKVRL